MAILSRFVVSLAAVPLLVAQAPKQKITRAADLPVFTYKMEPTVEDVLQSDQKFAALAAEIRKNVESVLANYETKTKLPCGACSPHWPRSTCSMAAMRKR